MSTANRAIAFVCASAVFFGMVVGPAAWAGPIIDKGDLGKYERKGRLVFRILTPPARNTEISPEPLYPADGKVAMDRGSLGVWERQGRFLRRQLRGTSVRSVVATHSELPKYRVVDHIQHKHRFPN